MKVADIASGARLICPGRTYRTPKVSIVTPTYRRNAEGLLAKCLDSAMAQTFTDLELIVVDDGSSDGSESTIRDAATCDDRIVYVRHDTNCGIPAIRTNEGVMLARGDAVSFLFDDNIFRPDFIEQAWNALEQSGADVVYANVHMLAKQGNDFTLGGWPLTLELLRNLNTIPNGGVMVRRSFFEKYGLYDPHILMRRICDWDLWLRALALGASFCHLDRIGAVEYGLVSANSVGNTVAWDVKVAYAYMLDEARFAPRSRALTPQQIGDYDVFDPAPIRPYVRSGGEWAELVETVYTPFMNRHGANGFDPAYPGNRAAALDPRQGWNAEWSLIGNRRRYLVVSNTINAWASAWLQALRRQPGAIVVNCPEWQLAAFGPADVDLLVLMDCTAGFIGPQLDAFRAASVPILYVLGYGEQASDSVPAEVASRLFENNPYIASLLGPAFYFPQAGVSFGPERREGAKVLAAGAYAAVSAREDADRLGLTDPVSLPLTPVAASGETLNAPEDWIVNLALCSQLARHIAQARRVPATRPNVGIFLNSEMFSGSEIYGLMLARGLQQAGARVHVVIPEESDYGRDSDAGPLNRWLLDQGIPPAEQAPYRPGPAFLALAPADRSAQLARLESFVSEREFAAIICVGFMPLFAELSNMRSLLFMALFQPSAYQQKHLACLRGRLSGIISDTRWALAAHLCLLGAPGAVVRPMPPVDSASPRAMKIPRASGVVRIAVGGTLQPRKRQLEAIKAAGILRDRGLPVQLNIYGYQLAILQSYMDDIQQAITELDLHDLAVCHGLVMPHVMARDNDIVLSASIDESLPQTLVEMMRLGLIGVAGLSGGIDELIEDGKTGYLTTDLSPGGLADALARAIGDRHRWTEVATNACALIERDYSIASNTSALLNLMIEGAQIESSPFGRLAPTRE